MIKNISILLALVLVCLLRCSAQNHTSKRQKINDKMQQYELELSPISTSESGVLRWELFLTDKRTNALARLDSIVLKPRGGTSYSELDGDPRESVSIAGAYPDGDTLYTMLVIERTVNVRTYPIKWGEEIRGTVYPYERIGIGSYMSTGKVSASAEFIPVSSLYMAIKTTGSGGMFSGLPLRLIDKQKSIMYHVALFDEENQFAPALVEGVDKIPAGEKVRFAINKIDSVESMPRKDIGVRAITQMPQLFDEYLLSKSTFGLLATIDQSSGLGRYSTGKVYFIYGDTTEGSIDKILWLNLLENKWFKGEYELQRLER